VLKRPEIENVGTPKELKQLVLDAKENIKHRKPSTSEGTLNIK
jgi:hypothetical protein